jgi:hypothetical protein
MGVAMLVLARRMDSKPGQDISKSASQNSATWSTFIHRRIARKDVAVWKQSLNFDKPGVNDIDLRIEDFQQPSQLLILNNQSVIG